MRNPYESDECARAPAVIAAACLKQNVWDDNSNQDLRCRTLDKPSRGQWLQFFEDDEIATKPRLWAA